MERLKLLLEKHPSWKPYEEYIVRIEGYSETDFSICIENAKALLEGISKEVCHQKGIALAKDSKMNGLLKQAFKALGYNSTSTMLQIGTAISTVGQQIGNFRNEVGTTAHGKTADELRNRQNTIDGLTGNFLIQSTALVSCFLIEAFETDIPLSSLVAEVPAEIIYDENEDFNIYWDEQFGEFEMGDYSFFPSQILHKLDALAYESELNAFRAVPNEIVENGE